MANQKPLPSTGNSTANVEPMVPKHRIFWGEHEIWVCMYNLYFFKNVTTIRSKTQIAIPTKKCVCYIGSVEGLKMTMLSGSLEKELDP